MRLPGPRAERVRAGLGAAMVLAAFDAAAPPRLGYAQERGAAGAAAESAGAAVASEKVGNDGAAAERVAGGNEASALEVRLHRAHDLYADGRWTEAEARYRSVLDGAPRSVAARHGLGNALYRQGRRGAALGQWLGALHLVPGDAAVRRNVDVVRAELAEAAGASDAETIAGPLGAPLDRLSPSSVAWTVAAALNAVAVAAVVALLAPRVRGVATALLVLILVAAAALAAAAGLAWAGRPRALVVSGQAHARASPSPTAAVALALPEGAALRVRDARGGWAFVSLPNGLSGWMPADEVAAIP